MLLRVYQDGDSGGNDAALGRRLENMAVGSVPQMSLFLTRLAYPRDDFQGEIGVTYSPPDAPPASITIPLQPDTTNLSEVSVTMHHSETTAYDMGEPFNKWFGDCFGYPVLLAYLGGHKRPVLFPMYASKPQPTASWLASIVSAGYLGRGQSDPSEQITFADVAPYLVVSETSLHEVSALLPAGEDMDVTKFRPNIVLAGAPAAWDEDYWAELAIGGPQGLPVTLATPHNCMRCLSVNVDYKTGRPGTGKAGQVLKMLQKGRRIDTGAKYSPAFGRYGFLADSGSGVIRVGDEVDVTQRSKHLTTFGKSRRALLDQPLLMTQRRLARLRVSL